MRRQATGPATGSPAIVPEGDPYRPHPAVVTAVAPESADVATFRVEFQDPKRQAAYHIRPGQFNMLYLPGVGEVPISVSSTPEEAPGIGHTIRFVGRVTNAMRTLTPGSVIGLRGPYGRPWPLERAVGRDVLLVAGGLGMAPLRSAVQALLADRCRYGRLTLLYGARQPADLLYEREHPEWRRRGMDMLVTVDRADASWRGRVGVVPVLFQKLRVDPSRTIMMTCGPEIMMRYSAAEARADQIDEQDIHISMERNMHCAVALCGHCQLGPEFVCKDGPVFSYPEIARYLSLKHF
jgi:NAD(P)H-flavin reductase